MWSVHPLWPRGCGESVIFVWREWEGLWHGFISELISLEQTLFFCTCSALCRTSKKKAVSPWLLGNNYTHPVAVTHTGGSQTDFQNVVKGKKRSAKEIIIWHAFNTQRGFTVPSKVQFSICCGSCSPSVLSSSTSMLHSVVCIRILSSSAQHQPARCCGEEGWVKFPMSTKDIWRLLH